PTDVSLWLRTIIPAFSTKALSQKQRTINLRNEAPEFYHFPITHEIRAETRVERGDPGYTSESLPGGHNQLLLKCGNILIENAPGMSPCDGDVSRTIFAELNTRSIFSDS